ncbi:MAG: fimbrillin family protein [Paludibacteraceae bacterium]|nr:fimbrillin family protein [Paludibacteraceae bacterium]
MKKLIYLAGAALVMLTSASCEKKADVQNPESKEGMVKTEFSAVSKESKEKTSISDADILWSEGDQIKIYAGTETTGNDFTLTEGDGTTTAKFEGLIAEIATAPYYAVYPSSQALSIDGSVIKFGIPAEQAYAENSFATNTVPMVAYSAVGKSLAFKNQTAFIKLQLKGEGTIKTMEIASASNNICGTFSISKTDPTAASTAVAGAKKITVTGISGTTLDATTPKNVIIALAPANFAANDLTLSMTATDGKAFSTKIGDFTIGRSQGKAVDVLVEFVMPPISGTAKRIGDIDVEWVQLWAGGPKWAVYNVGAESIGEYGEYYSWGGKTNKSNTDYYKGSEALSGDDDTATNKWGGNWRMPTNEELKGILSNCTYTVKDGCAIFEGKGDYSSNSISFPFAGYYESGVLNLKGTLCKIWSSTPKSSLFRHSCQMGGSSASMDSAPSDKGYSVRAVLAE